MVILGNLSCKPILLHIFAPDFQVGHGRLRGDVKLQDTHPCQSPKDCESFNKYSTVHRNM